MKKSARKKIKITVKITEAANGTRPQDMNNEQRYVANPHQNKVSTPTSVVYATSIRNEVDRTTFTTAKVGCNY